MKVLVNVYQEYIAELTETAEAAVREFAEKNGCSIDTALFELGQRQQEINLLNNAEKHGNPYIDYVQEINE